MSKKGGGGGSGSNAAADTQARLAEQLFSQTDPTRVGLINRSQDFLESGDVTASPQFAFLKDITESQFGRAQDSVIAGTPTGGALTSALGDLERDRASSLIQGTAALNESELARAMTLATGTTGQSLGALGSAGSIQAQEAAARASQSAGKAGALGQGAGAYAGLKASGNK